MANITDANGCTCTPFCPFKDNNKEDTKSDAKDPPSNVDLKGCTCVDDEGKCSCIPTCRFQSTSTPTPAGQATKSDAKDPKIDPKGCTCATDEGKCGCRPSCRFLGASGQGQQDSEFVPCTCTSGEATEGCECDSVAAADTEKQEPPERTDKNIQNEIEDEICTCPSLATTDYTKWDCRKNKQ